MNETTLNSSPFPMSIHDRVPHEIQREEPVSHEIPDDGQGTRPEMPQRPMIDEGREVIPGLDEGRSRISDVFKKPHHHPNNPRRRPYSDPKNLPN